MNVDQILSEVCDEVVADGERALEAQHVDRSRAALNLPQVLSMEMAELHNLNDVATRVVTGSRPLWKALGIRMALQLDPLLPPVQMLVQPTEEALAAAMDICLQGDLDLLRVKTQVFKDRAVATLERLLLPGPFATAPGTSELLGGDDPTWRDAGDMGRLELVVACRTTKALGGRMSIQHRRGDLRLRLELPILSRPHSGWLAGHPRPPHLDLGHGALNFPSPAGTPTHGQFRPC